MQTGSIMSLGLASVLPAHFFFEQLLKLGVDVKNKMAIMRYGAIFRGNKV